MVMIILPSIISNLTHINFIEELLLGLFCLLKLLYLSILLEERNFPAPSFYFGFMLDRGCTLLNIRTVLRILELTHYGHVLGVIISIRFSLVDLFLKEFDVFQLHFMFQTLQSYCSTLSKTQSLGLLTHI